MTSSCLLSSEFLLPNWNTELEALFELAMDNEFQQNDTTALAIAMVDGFFRTIGDKGVKRKVRIDDNKMLNLAREINQWQKENGFYLLNDLSLEAKVAWAWRGNTTMARGPFNLQNYKSGKLPLKGYLWNTIDPDTLRDMKVVAEEKRWVKRDVKDVIYKIEDYFFFSGMKKNWFYQTCPEIIKDIEDVDVACGQVLNVDYQFYKRFMNLQEKMRLS